jgi:hypothetical protein
VAALWGFSEWVVDHAPARVAPDLLRALPAPFSQLWRVYHLSAVPVLAQTLADPAAFDGLGPEAPQVVRDVVEIARIVAGLAPSGGAPERVRAFGDRLFGREPFVRAPADALRRHSVAPDPTAPGRPPELHPDEVAVVIAAEAMTPEETGAYAVRFATLLGALEAAGPTVRRGLIDALVQSLARRPGEGPARADALLAYDGSWRDTYVSAYLVGLPIERALAVVRREVAGGRGEFVRRSLAATPLGGDLLAALDG